MNISFENVNKLIILNYLYDNFRKGTGYQYLSAYTKISRKTDRIIDGHGPWSNSMSFCCCCCLLTKVFGLRAKLLITPGSNIFRQTSLGLQKGLSVYQKSEKVYWVNNQHEQTKSLQSQVKDLLLQSIYTRTFYLLSHAFRQFPKTVTTLIIYIQIKTGPI